MLFKKYMSVTKTMIYQTIVAADYTKGQSLTIFKKHKAGVLGQIALLKV